MPARTVLIKVILSISLLVFISGCEHWLVFLKPFSNSIFRAIVHGAIKDTRIHCEKSIEEVSDRWQIMCKIDDAIDIKYRTIKLNNEETRFEMLIDKQKGEEKKTIAASVMLVSKSHPAKIVAVNSKGSLEFHVECLK
jgi:hypothetical protein